MILRIREIRKRCGLTMKELGDRVGVGESTISQYETGKRQPDYEILLRIADYFGVSVDYLLGKEKTPAETGRREVTDDDIKFALFGTTDVDDAIYEDIKKLARSAAQIAKTVARKEK